MYLLGPMSAKLPERREGINCRTADSRAASEILSADLASYTRTIKYKSVKQESIYRRTGWYYSAKLC